ncbi:unnamed protein product [Ostreobium quekettii]|uniref:Large ribosomal subunit protein uL4c n=1 Tax=Ostreobium quekettii TaxID=121088 RepID=A0A8S1JAJ8_9CHLO|nr:unnamed protein product [Ostreobium quekettii]|eukprot:evm.model.scf_677.4 EVM.evm.TU.scf_677.4   scf_677:49734-51988(+)
MRPSPFHARRAIGLKAFCGVPLRSPSASRPQKCADFDRRGQPAPVITMSYVAEPATLDLKSIDGVTKGMEKLSLKVADPDTANGLVHRYMVKVRRDMRRGTASTKTRGEVRGGGRKPYAQKKTGRARRGSSRSPLIVGGGVVFGPKPRDWSVKMNEKERRLALATALQSAADAGDIIVTEDLTEQFQECKTKALVSSLRQIGVPEDKYCLLLTLGKHDNVTKSGRNVPWLMMNTTRQINVYDVLKADKIVMEQSALKHVQSFYGVSES